MGMKQKKIQNGRLKKTEIFKTPNFQKKNLWKFHGLVLGLVVLMWLNLYGHEAVLRKLKPA